MLVLNSTFNLSLVFLKAKKILVNKYILSFIYTIKKSRHGNSGKVEEKREGKE